MLLTLSPHGAMPVAALAENVGVIHHTPICDQTVEQADFERGPPATCACIATYDAVDSSSRGTSAPHDGTTPRAYDHAALLVRRPGTTKGQAHATDGPSHTFEHWRVVANGGANAVRIGQAGETAVGSAFDIGPKATRVINGRTRIFDGLNLSAVSEVKNVRRLSYTRQPRDYTDYATQDRLGLDIFVRGGTKISGPLARADLDPMIPVSIIRYLE